MTPQPWREGNHLGWGFGVGAALGVVIVGALTWVAQPRIAFRPPTTRQG